MPAPMLLFLAAVLCCTSLSTAGKSHQILVTRVQPEYNKEWFMPNFTLKLHKGQGNVKLVYVNYTLLQDAGNEIMCEIKLSQQVSGKYMKAPADFPVQSCCTFVDMYRDIWTCILKFSNLPEKCPLNKGNYVIADLDVNHCDHDFSFPMGMPENYRAEYKAFKGPETILKIVFYATSKKRFTF